MPRRRVVMLVWGQPANDDDELVTSMAALLLDGATPEMVLVGIMGYVRATRKEDRS